MSSFLSLSTRLTLCAIFYYSSRVNDFYAGFVCNFYFLNVFESCYPIAWCQRSPWFTQVNRDSPYKASVGSHRPARYHLHFARNKYVLLLLVNVLWLFSIHCSGYVLLKNNVILDISYGYSRKVLLKRCCSHPCKLLYHLNITSLTGDQHFDFHLGSNCFCTCLSIFLFFFPSRLISTMSS